jgi:hydrogenase maturation protease
VRRTAPRTAVIGIGNPTRGDDGAGPAVLARLRGRVGAHVDLIAHDGEATTLLDLLQGARRAYLIDACHAGEAPGTVRRIDALACPLPRDGRQGSTHGLGVAQGLELGRALALLPQQCVVYCIEGACYEPGAPLSSPVRAAIDTVAARLLAEVPE